MIRTVLSTHAHLYSTKGKAIPWSVSDHIRPPRSCGHVKLALLARDATPNTDFHPIQRPASAQQATDAFSPVTAGKCPEHRVDYFFGVAPVNLPMSQPIDME